jgi:hypothetical protein
VWRGKAFILENRLTQALHGKIDVINGNYDYDDFFNDSAYNLLIYAGILNDSV